MSSISSVFCAVLTVAEHLVNPDREPLLNRDNVTGAAGPCLTSISLKHGLFSWNIAFGRLVVIGSSNWSFLLGADPSSLHLSVQLHFVVFTGKLA